MGNLYVVLVGVLRRETSLPRSRDNCHRTETTSEGVFSMPNVEKISIALPPEMVSLVRNAVESGEYSSTSKVIRGALHA